MQDFQLQNLSKVSRQTEQKLAALDRLVQKITELNNKEKINSVMMRNVQIKHTSEFMIKINEQYFAEVKTNAALTNLQRKKKNYEQVLKKVNYKIELLEKKKKKTVNQKNENQFLNKYQQSTVQSIGKNQQGQQIFNIIQVEGQEDTDISQWSNTKQKQTIEQPKFIKTNKQASKQEVKNRQQDKNFKLLKTQHKVVNQSKQSSEQQQDEGGDLLFDQGEYSQNESSLEEIYEQQNDDDMKQSDKKGNKTTTQSQQKQQKPQEQLSSKMQVNQSLQNETSKQKQSKTPQPSKDTKAQQLSQTKPQQKATQQPKAEPPKQQPKPISRFKLQRMKQKLQQSIQ